MLLAACSLLLSSCEDHNWRDGMRGRSDFFVDRDFDRDDRITRAEWERRAGTQLWSPHVRRFDELDCDDDGILQWSEYYRGVFRSSTKCRVTDSHYPVASEPNGPVDRPVRYSATLCGPAGAYERTIHLHREEDISARQTELVTVKCEEPMLGNAPLTGLVRGRCTRDGVESSSTNRGVFVPIYIENTNEKATITLIKLGLSLGQTEDSTSEVSWHLKTVSVGPGSTQLIKAWINKPPITDEEVRPIEVDSC